MVFIACGKKDAVVQKAAIVPIICSGDLNIIYIWNKLKYSVNDDVRMIDSTLHICKNLLLFDQKILKS